MTRTRRAAPRMVSWLGCVLLTVLLGLPAPASAEPESTRVRGAGYSQQTVYGFRNVCWPPSPPYIGLGWVGCILGDLQAGRLPRVETATYARSLHVDAATGPAGPSGEVRFAIAVYFGPGVPGPDNASTYSVNLDCVHISDSGEGHRELRVSGRTSDGDLVFVAIREGEGDAYYGFASGENPYGELCAFAPEWAPPATSGRVEGRFLFTE